MRRTGEERAMPTGHVRHDDRTADPRAGMNRRHFLRGLGACVALPLFESLWPAGLFAADPAAGAVAVTPTGAPLRTAFVYFPNGAIPAQWWPTGEGADFQLNRTLQPLERSKPYL